MDDMMVKLLLENLTCGVKCHDRQLRLTPDWTLCDLETGYISQSLMRIRWLQLMSSEEDDSVFVSFISG